MCLVSCCTLGSFLLTNLLLDDLKKTGAESGDSRIVNISSSLHSRVHRKHKRRELLWTPCNNSMSIYSILSSNFNIVLRFLSDLFYFFEICLDRRISDKLRENDISWQNMIVSSSLRFDVYHSFFYIVCWLLTELFPLFHVFFLTTFSNFEWLNAEDIDRFVV